MHCPIVKSRLHTCMQAIDIDKVAKPVPPLFAAQAVRNRSRKLEYVALVTSVEDSRDPPGNRLYVFKGDRQEPHAIAVNDQCSPKRRASSRPWDCATCSHRPTWPRQKRSTVLP